MIHQEFGHTVVVVVAVDMGTQRGKESRHSVLLRRLAVAAVEGRVRHHLYPDNSSVHSPPRLAVVLRGVQMPVAELHTGQRGASIRTLEGLHGC